MRANYNEVFQEWLPWWDIESEHKPSNIDIVMILSEESNIAIKEKNLNLFISYRNVRDQEVTE